MSAYVVSHNHINYLVRAMNEYAHTGYIKTYYYNNEPVHFLSDLNRVGRVLAQANVNGVQHRYPDDLPYELPGPIPTPIADRYQYNAMQPLPITGAAVLKALAGYVYQASELPDWEESEAYAICRHIREEAIRNLPGYEDADWDID